MDKNVGLCLYIFSDKSVYLFLIWIRVVEDSYFALILKTDRVKTCPKSSKKKKKKKHFIRMRETVTEMGIGCLKMVKMDIFALSN